MSQIKRFHRGPSSISFRTSHSTIPLIVHGQGVFVFNTQTPATFTFYNADQTDGLLISLDSTAFYVRRISDGNEYNSDKQAVGGLTPKKGAYYWFSLDSQNQVFQAGIGEPRIETITYYYAFNRQDKLWEANKMFFESLTQIQYESMVQPIRLVKDPITTQIPYLIKGTNDLTMDDVASNRYLPSAALSASAQQLYGCVSGEKFVLNSDDFPEFSNAIEYSIATPGCWCYERLQQKATEFNKNPQPLETYLRITLGQNNGESPGIPYVMEIWPIGHYSPIHNHSGANAIIRVLHGSIHVQLFPYLCTDEEGVDPFASADFETNDITWLSPSHNQIHRLVNLETNKDTCITIQCYLYDADDVKHYDYFDYLGEKNAKNQYEPDSDMDFISFKEQMKKEWKERPVIRRFHQKPT